MYPVALHLSHENISPIRSHQSIAVSSVLAAKFDHGLPVLRRPKMAKYPQDRAHRRFHRYRVIQKRRRLQWVKSNEKWATDLPPDEKTVYLSHLWGSISKVAKPCSCYMCCNPRHGFGGGNGAHIRTRQEVVADLNWSEE